MIHLSLALLAAGAPVPASGFAPLPEAPFLAAAPLRPAEEHEGIELPYTFLEVGYLQVDPEAIDDEADAYYFRAQVEIAFVYLFGQYQKQEFDTNNLEVNNVDLGVGLHLDMGDRLDLQAELGVIYSDFSDDVDLDDDETGFQARAGARALLLPWAGGGLEGEANLVYRDLDSTLDDSGDLGGQGGLRLHLLGLLSVGAMYTSVGDVDELTANVRLSF